MQILNDLKSQLALEQSMFRAQLMREDIARLEKLLVLAGTSADLAAFKKAGTYIGWTQNDMMTHRVAEPLGTLLDAIFDYSADQARDEAVSTAWLEFCKMRNEKLIKCL
ncbi:MAG: hypothetical protein ACR2OM_13700 [Aestuariivirgaceae bacterium]